MIYLCILAAIVVAITWITAFLLIPAWPAFMLVWSSVAIFTLAVLMLFAGLVSLSSFAKNEQNKNPSLLYSLGGYVVFCFLAIFVSFVLSTYSGLLLLHLCGIFIACVLGFVMRSAQRKSAAFAAKHKADKIQAFNRAEKLSEICSALKMRQIPELSSGISMVHLFSEKLRYAAGHVDSECDAELDALILDLAALTKNTTSDADLLEKLPNLLQSISNKLAKRERLAVL